MTNGDFLKQKLAIINDPKLTRYALRRAEVLFEDGYLDEPVGNWTAFMIVPFIGDMQFSLLHDRIFSAIFTELGFPYEEPELVPDLQILPGGKSDQQLTKKQG